MRNMCNSLRRLNWRYPCTHVHVCSNTWNVCLVYFSYDYQRLIIFVASVTVLAVHMIHRTVSGNTRIPTIAMMYSIVILLIFIILSEMKFSHYCYAACNVIARYIECANKIRHFKEGLFHLSMSSGVGFERNTKTSADCSLVTFWPCWATLRAKKWQRRREFFLRYIQLTSKLELNVLLLGNKNKYHYPAHTEGFFQKWNGLFNILFAISVLSIAFRDKQISFRRVTQKHRHWYMLCTSQCSTFNYIIIVMTRTFPYLCVSLAIRAIECISFVFLVTALFTTCMKM